MRPKIGIIQVIIEIFGTKADAMTAITDPDTTSSPHTDRSSPIISFFIDLFLISLDIQDVDVATPISLDVWFSIMCFRFFIYIFFISFKYILRIFLQKSI